MNAPMTECKNCKEEVLIPADDGYCLECKAAYNAGRESGQDGTCPFCREDGFDLIGLKIHLRCGYCAKYNETPLWDPKEKPK